MTKTVILLGLLAALIVVPLTLRTGSGVAREGRPLIIMTPHNEQIRGEFGRAFDAWHRERFGEPVDVIWSVPGGTSEIRKMLVAQWESALKKDDPVGGSADLVFGGGTYEHEVLKRGVEVVVDGETKAASISAPVEIPPEELERIYGENRVGDSPLYDPERHWFGTALSGFGIVYNRDVLDRLGLPAPTSWDDLCRGELLGWLALVNPGQSGSVTTAFDAILQRRGWRDGWRILRRAAASSRYFSASSLKPPIDVSRGDAAMGVCIDFYGRYQAQAIKVSGSPDRIGYVDPPGETLIDPDPISMLDNAPDPELAERFVRFCLSPAAQALWQFRVDDPIDDGLGPHVYELRRLPVLRSMYAEHFDRLIDPVDPFRIARPVESPDRNFRSFIAVLFSALAIDSHHELRDAWRAIVTHPAYPRDLALVGAEDVSDPTLAMMLRRFDGMPSVPGPDGTLLSLESVEDLPAIKSGWLRDGWIDDGLWSPQERGADVLRRRLVEQFRTSYRAVVDMAGGALVRGPGGQERHDGQSG
ncbi:MAG: ABC transporter substrate-binding protein [Planctomycetota bacterium]